MTDPFLDLLYLLPLLSELIRHSIQFRANVLGFIDLDLWGRFILLFPTDKLPEKEGIMA
jgi:hypothetical protein